MPLVESAAEYLPNARWQRCLVHFYRNVFSHVPSTKVREVSHMLKAIHAQEGRDAATEKAKAVMAELRRQRMTRAAKLIEDHVEETLTYYTFTACATGSISFSAHHCFSSPTLCNAL